jgi:hypothetical protein
LAQLKKKIVINELVLRGFFGGDRYWIEPRALCILSKHATTKLNPDLKKSEYFE